MHVYTHADYTNFAFASNRHNGVCVCANALAAIAAWQVARWTMTLRRVQGVKLVKQVKLLLAGARSGAG